MTLPSDLIKAGKLAAGGDAGLTLDVPGLVATRFDLDVKTPRGGEADVTVTSSAIPKLPIAKGKGLGRACYECGNGNPQSDWCDPCVVGLAIPALTPAPTAPTRYFARNLGNGVEFYGNAKTGVSQFDVPNGY